MIADHLAELVRTALARANEGRTPAEEPEIRFERPKRREHGDWSTNVAMVAGEGNPRELAQRLVDLMPESRFVERVELAGPGFINFYLSSAWLHNVIVRAADPESGFGRTDEGKGMRVNVEYVSANPTGPINVVSGRHAAFGDSISNLLKATGYDVTREFYVNDVGRQTRLFGASIAAHYLTLQGKETPVPEDGYHGDYVEDIAKAIIAEHGDKFVNVSEEERETALARLGLELMLKNMRSTLESFGTRFDVWFRESQLHESGAVEWAISDLKQRGYIEERDGALWFLSSKFGDDKDRVIIRSNGEPTYLAADTAYLLNKFERGFKHLTYVWGADHHGTVLRLGGVAQAMGFDSDQVEVLLVQIVTLKSGGETLKASKRKGVLVPLADLLEEVGVDAVRYMFLTRSIDAPLEFDIELAKEQAPENPVYYVQYAHARISSILRKAADEGVEVDVNDAQLGRLEHQSENALMRKLASYEEVIPQAAGARTPQKLTRYVEELASDFSSFYRDCKVITDDGELTRARLALCVATRSVVADGLNLLGVGAPERM
ncbi:MAG TPA: arginine--tRNA ligase [Actinomycetota bacterium]|nr:arginine--tRNA ligase [Actinomycetota bacterium]